MLVEQLTDQINSWFGKKIMSNLVDPQLFVIFGCQLSLNHLHLCVVRRSS